MFHIIFHLILLYSPYIFIPYQLPVTQHKRKADYPEVMSVRSPAKAVVLVVLPYADIFLQQAGWTKVAHLWHPGLP